MVLTSCTAGSSPATTSTSLPSATTSPAIQLVPFDGETMSLEIGGEMLTVAVADSADERAQGLMEVTDLGDVDGMLFVFEASRSVTFTMRNTVIPLDIWFIDDAGIIVDAQEMVPCSEEPCPDYNSAGKVINALETPLGVFEFEIGDTVEFG